MTEPTAAPEPVRPRNRLVLAIAAGVVLVLGGIVTWSIVAKGEAEPTTFELRGSMTLVKNATAYTEGRGKCIGYRGYDDIGEGAQVTVSDATGKAIALGTLEKSEYAGGRCTFQFAVPNVPDGQAIYQVEVAHRGKVSFEADKARTGKVSLTLG